MSRPAAASSCHDLQGLIPPLSLCATSIDCHDAWHYNRLYFSKQSECSSLRSVVLLAITFAGDGACMFRAIAQGNHFIASSRPIAPAQEDQAAADLRSAIVDELKRSRDDIEPFLPGISTNFDQYLQRMAQSATWGGKIQETKHQAACRCRSYLLYMRWPLLAAWLGTGAAVGALHSCRFAQQP